VPQSLYEFPEFGWERLGASRSAGAANSAWTPGEAVLGYVQAYVKHFELEQHIRWVGEGGQGSAGGGCVLSPAAQHSKAVLWGTVAQHHSATTTTTGFEQQLSSTANSNELCSYTEQVQRDAQRDCWLLLATAVTACIDSCSYS
jgi:hypothetical protein